MALVDFTIGGTAVHTEWKDTDTARQLIAAFPLETTGHYWGAEFYLRVPVKAAPESDSVEVVPRGTVAFWVQGACLCLFWGPTPASYGDECRAASRVNVLGRVLNPEVLPSLQGEAVRVEEVA